jgi:hypothetical protein
MPKDNDNYVMSTGSRGEEIEKRKTIWSSNKRKIRKYYRG